MRMNVQHSSGDTYTVVTAVKELRPGVFLSLNIEISNNQQVIFMGAWLASCFTRRRDAKL